MTQGVAARRPTGCGRSRSRPRRRDVRGSPVPIAV